MDVIAYWSAMSQVAPVLGLAHVLETRQALKGTRSAPPWWRMLLGVLHFASLASLALLCVLSLSVLGGLVSDPAPEGCRPVAILIVAFSTGTLVFGPALNALVVAIAHPVSVIGSIAPVMRWHLRRLEQGIAEDENELATFQLDVASKRLDLRRQAMKMQRELNWIDNAIQHVRRLIADGRLKGQQLEEARANVSEGERNRGGIVQTLEECETLISKMSDSRFGETLSARRLQVVELDRRLLEIRRQTQKRTERIFLAAAGVDFGEQDGESGNRESAKVSTVT